MLGTSYAWSVTGSSKGTSEAAYYITDWRILDQSNSEISSEIEATLIPNSIQLKCEEITGQSMTDSSAHLAHRPVTALLLITCVLSPQGFWMRISYINASLEYYITRQKTNTYFLILSLYFANQQIKQATSTHSKSLGTQDTEKLGQKNEDTFGLPLNEYLWNFIEYIVILLIKNRLSNVKYSIFSTRSNGS